MDWQTTFREPIAQAFEPVEAVWMQMAGFLPTLLSVVFILAFGWILATLAQRYLTRALKLARMDAISERVGIANALSKGDINYTLSEIIGVVIYWFLILIFALAAVNTLQLTVAAELLNQVILYLPNVVASIFILVLGIFFSSILGNTVRTAAANAGMQQSRLLGQISQSVIVVFAVVEALKQLRIDTSVIEMLIIAVLAAVALGVGLAIGLGCKDLAGRYVAQFIDSFKARR